MKLNLGSGDCYAKGWLNVDLPTTPHRFDQSADIRRTLPWQRHSIERVYLGHVLEHLTIAEGTTLLRRLRPLMAPRKGVALAVGPDINRARKLLKRSDLDPELFQMIRLGGNRWPGDRHKWECEPRTLEAMFRDAGWRHVREVEVGRIRGSWPIVSRVGWQCAVRADA